MPTDTAEIPRAERLAQAGKWLREQREQRVWSGRQLAAKINVTPIQVSAYERGRDGIGDVRAAAIAKAFGLQEIYVRAMVGLWVPGDYEPSAPQMVTPEEAIRGDPTLRPDQRETVLGMLALIRGQAAPPPPAAPATSGEYDPDAPPWRPGDDR